jgi:hypothetical protein
VVEGAAMLRDEDLGVPTAEVVVRLMDGGERELRTMKALFHAAAHLYMEAAGLSEDEAMKAIAKAAAVQTLKEGYVL